MESQPPPNAPPPPISEAALRSRKYHKVLMMVPIAGLVMLLVLGATLPIVLRSPKNGPFVESLGNSKQIGLALMEFERDYGSYPGVNTIERVKETTGTDIPLGTASSNDFLRQLLAAGIGNEKMCYARSQGSKKPDDIMSGSNALEKGECGFAYIPGQSSSNAMDMPVLIAGLIRGTDKVDRKTLKEKVVVLHIDGSVWEGKMDKDGHLIISGKRLLDPTNPIWGGKPPALVWPE